jgi:hypothetical protein
VQQVYILTIAMCFHAYVRVVLEDAEVCYCQIA